MSRLRNKNYLKNNTYRKNLLMTANNKIGRGHKEMNNMIRMMVNISKHPKNNGKMIKMKIIVKKNNGLGIQGTMIIR